LLLSTLVTAVILGVVYVLVQSKLFAPNRFAESPGNSGTSFLLKLLLSLL